MKMILIDIIKNKQQKNTEEGFSLVETMIALTTLGICLAYAMPLFLYAKINNSKSEIRTGALIVSQRIFDDIRSRKVSSLPDASSSSTVNPEIKNKNTNSGNDRLLVTAMGRDYVSKVTFCEVASDCSTKYRKFKVEIFRNGTTNESKVYDLEGTFTEFE